MLAASACLFLLTGSRGNVVERYTERARRAIFYARVEAGRFGSAYIETEHLLLGLIREDSPLVNRFLVSEVSEDSIRRQIVAVKSMRESIPPTVDIPLAEESDSALSYATEEAGRLRHQHLGMEHMLLGLLRKQDCFAALMLRERGAELEVMRKHWSTTPPPVFPEARTSRSFEELSRSVHEEERMVLERGAGLEGHASGMFERYTEKARRTIFFARYEASQFGCSCIETEHLVLGVFREHNALANQLLASEAIRDSITQRRAPGLSSTSVDLPLSHESKRALACAAEESERMNHKRIGTVHLLLGLLREENSFGAQLLREQGLTLDLVREEAKQSEPTLVQDQSVSVAGFDQWLAEREAPGGIWTVKRFHVANRTTYFAI